MTRLRRREASSWFFVRGAALATGRRVDVSVLSGHWAARLEGRQGAIFERNAGSAASNPPGVVPIIKVFYNPGHV